MCETRFYKEHYPVTNATLSLMSDRDKDRLIGMFIDIRIRIEINNQYAMQKAARHGRYYTRLGYVRPDVDEKTIAKLIMENPSGLRQEDIEFLNDVLYYNKYVFASIVRLIFNPNFLLRNK